MPSTSELSPIASQYGTSAPANEPARVGIQPIDILKRHWKLAVGVALGVGLAGGLVLHVRMKPIYEATAIVYVSPIFPTALADDHDHDRQYDEFLEQQITSATRYETLQKALHAYPEAWPKLWAEEPEQSQIVRLQHALKVAQVGHSYEAAITLESTQKEHLAEFVNKITEQYLADARDEEVYGRDQKLATLTQERSDLQKQLNDAFEQQGKLLHDVGMAHFDASAGANPYDDTLSKLRDQLDTAHEKSAEADAEYRSMGSGNLSNPALQEAAAEEVKADISVQSLKTQLITKRAANLAQLAELKPGTPLYAQVDADNAEIDRRLDQIDKEATRRAATRIVERLRGAKARSAGLEGQLMSDVAKTQAQASTAAPRLQQAQALSGLEDRIQALLGVVEKRIQDVSLEGDSPGSVHLFSRALPPGGPVKRKTAMAYGALLFASLIAGFAAAFLADKMDPHVYTSLDVRRLVGFPPIGLLLSRTEFSPEMQKEYFLRLAGGLDQAHRRTGARTFVFPAVGSRSSSELVERLGAELAANGLRVLVVNILPAPGRERSSRAGGERQASGGPQVDGPSPRLLSVSDGASQLSTDVDKEPFRVISLPASEVAELLRRSRSYYNAILVAADPLFTSAYTEHFARTADGTVLIVESGATRKDELVRAARLLERLKIAGIAIVLDGVTEQRAEEDVARQIADYRRNAA
jgi:uncharacterized protein involved in exopolysaccharide biosynthesis